MKAEALQDYYPRLLSKTANMAATTVTEIPSPSTDLEAYTIYCYRKCGELIGAVSSFPGYSAERIAAITSVLAFINGTGRHFLLTSPRKLQLVVLSKCWEMKSQTPSCNMKDEIKDIMGLIGHILPVPFGLCGECPSCCAGMAQTCMSHYMGIYSSFMHCERDSGY